MDDGGKRLNLVEGMCILPKEISGKELCDIQGREVDPMKVVIFRDEYAELIFPNKENVLLVALTPNVCRKFDEKEIEYIRAEELVYPPVPFPNPNNSTFSLLDAYKAHAKKYFQDLLRELEAKYGCCMFEYYGVRFRFLKETIDERNT